MATARSLSGIDWIVRTYGPSLLTACNQPGKASTLAGAQPITNTTRLNSAIGALDTMEQQAKADYTTAWDAAWQQAVNKVQTEVTANPIPTDELMADPDQSVKTAYKTALRGLELNAAQFVAGGGVFP